MGLLIENEKLNMSEILPKIFLEQFSIKLLVILIFNSNVLYIWINVDYLAQM